MTQQLSILMMLHMPWDENLGGPRPQMELAAEFRKLGHRVEKYDVFDAFPSAKRESRIAPLIRSSFSSKAKAFLRENVGRFDIIDALQGNLPFSKRELGFQGLLVARSVGLYAFHEQCLQFVKTKWPPKHKGNPIANVFRSWRTRRESPYPLRSLKNCDLINVPNSDEFIYLRDVLGFGGKCKVLPFGLRLEQRNEFASAIRPMKERLNNKTVVFIGSWSPSKGAKDWAEIMLRIKGKIPDARFLFLGTGLSADKVLDDLKLSCCDWVKVIPHYKNKELSKLLGAATVGVFPSYIEGFGFAVLEKLACGLPTVAYDVPGPREMLRRLDTQLLIPAGDIKRLSNKVTELLKLDSPTYTNLSGKCVEVAREFTWPKIARATIDTYFDAFNELATGNRMKTVKEASSPAALVDTTFR
jgi:glycosyltransferase involved in cell wall biosynthesis